MKALSLVPVAIAVAFGGITPTHAADDATSVVIADQMTRHRILIRDLATSSIGGLPDRRIAVEWTIPPAPIH